MKESYKNVHRAFFRKTMNIWILLIISIIVTFFVWSNSKNYYDTRAKNVFMSHVNEDVDHLNRQILRYETVLRSGVAFFQGSDNVSREEWHKFVSTLQLNQHYPGMQGIGYSKMLRADEIASTEKQMRSDGYPSFKLKPSGMRNEYSSILFLEPMDKRNLRAIGYDMFSEPVRRLAMEKARDTGHPTLSGRVKLVQEMETDIQPGILMYLAYYKKNLPINTVEERRIAIEGFVYSPFRMNDLMRVIALKDPDINFEIYDVDHLSSRNLLYRSFNKSSYHPKFTAIKVIEINGQIWHIHFYSSEKFDAEHSSKSPVLYTVIGLLVYILLMFIILGLITSRRIMAEKSKELISHKTRLRTLLNSATDGVHIIDMNGKIIEYSPSFASMLGYTNDEMAKLNIFDIDPKFSIQEILSAFEPLPEEPITLETMYRSKNGEFIDVEITAQKILLDDERYIYASSRDITEHKKSEKELKKLSQAIEQSPNTVIITDLAARIEYVNNAFTASTGYTLDEIIGKNPRFLQSGKTPTTVYIDLWEKLKQGKSWNGEFTNLSKDGKEFTEEVTISPIIQPDGNITHYMAIKDDITEKKRAAERIHYLANYDLLTGLPNRSQLNDRIQYALNDAKRNAGEIALLFLDLDRFKDINDTLGHSIGDLLLRELAKRVKKLLREEDTLSRLGGDEFIFMLPHTSTQGAAFVAEKILDVLTQSFDINENELNVTASIGIAIYPYDGSDPDTLTKNADAAMYEAKQKGRNNYQFFTKAMQENASKNLQLINGLRHAVEKNQLSIMYQPQIAIAENKIIGLEALVRWEHPEFGNIPPSEFIPLAEDSGLILSIGEWVLRRTVEQAKKWLDAGLPETIIAVNLSAVQFRHPHLPEIVTSILEEFDLPSKYLELELTEAVAMHDPQSVISMMDRLHAKGIRMSIDDFGTGYSSLSYIKKFKVYKLKIDQSFIADISDDLEDKAIVKAIIRMAHSLGLRVIAEGVETTDQLAFLKEELCDEVQGYLYSKPLRANDYELFVNDWKLKH
ncbi:MAG: GGDEF domain-containing protein [Sulfuricurvum sp. PD_MW2]|nr:MAG: GGDEF domain-containing protein [Sulfuricurvum sp. PD_MW2]